MNPPVAVLKKSVKDPSRKLVTMIASIAITQLRVESTGRVEIEIGGRAPAVTFSRQKDVQATVTREGDTLVVAIDAGGNRWHGTTIVTPAWLERIDARASVAIEAKRPVARMRIATTAPLAWDGAATSLEIRRRSHAHGDATHADAGDDACTDHGVVDVEGKVDALVVVADVGRVYVDRQRGHGHVTLDLADGVTFDIENALDLGGVTLRRRAPGVAADTTGAMP